MVKTMLFFLLFVFAFGGRHKLTFEQMVRLYAQPKIEKDSQKCNLFFTFFSNISKKDAFGKRQNFLWQAFDLRLEEKPFFKKLKWQLLLVAHAEPRLQQKISLRFK